MSSTDGVAREALVNRDRHIMDRRVAGMSVNNIAKALNISNESVMKAIERQVARSKKDSLQSLPELVFMELERLDILQSYLWPFVQPRPKLDAEGRPTDDIVPPDMTAFKHLMTIMERRAKLIGLDQINVDVMHRMEDPSMTEIRSSLHGKEETRQLDNPEELAKDEVIGLLEVMGSSGVLPEETVTSIMSNIDNDKVVDVEIVEKESESDSEVKESAKVEVPSIVESDPENQESEMFDLIMRPKQEMG